MTGNVFTLALNVESVVTALAVNYDVLRVRDLIDVYTLIETLIFNGIEYQVEVKYYMGNF